MNSSNQLAHWLKQRGNEPCHRQLLVISGTEKWTMETVTSLQIQNTGNLLWVGGKPINTDYIEVKDYRLKLGQEYDCVVLNCFKGFRANAAMALSGTITRHGLMILLCPDFTEWPEYSDPEQINRLSYGYQNELKTSYFFKHLIDCFKSDKSVAIATPDSFIGEHALVGSQSKQTSFDDQIETIEKICKVITGHRNRPLVITADRGRGKSSALGIASARLMKSRKITIWVTAHHLKAVEHVFKHCSSELPHSIANKHKLQHQDSILIFKPVDKLLESEDHADLVIVDEAATLPIHILLKLVTKFPRVVFSSTVHGYEGSGRGFEVKFKKQLAEAKPEYRTTHLSHPIRWFQNDALEAFWFNAMFHKSTHHKVEVRAEQQSANLSFQDFKQLELLDKPEVLSQVFSLLQDAHYQTSPDDLQRLLDAPETLIFGLYQGDILVGVAHILEEGGEALSELASEIASCQRRVKGHMVAQNLMSTYNMANLSKLRQWRISRIAILPMFQGKGFGTKLLSHIENQAIQHQISLLTTSFGCTSRLLKFWENANLTPVKLGLKPEVSSGEYNCICIKPITAIAEQAHEYIREEFFNGLLFNMDKSLKSLPSKILLQLLASDGFKKPLFNKGIVDQFTLGARPMTSSKRHLRAVLLNNASYLLSLEKDLRDLITRVLLQDWATQQVSAVLKFNGKKDIEIHIKHILSNISNKQ